MIDLHNKLAALIPVLIIVLFLMSCDIKPTFQQKMPGKKLGHITNSRLISVGNEPEVWLTGGRDYHQSYFSPLNSINDKNITKVGYAWSYDIDTTHGFEATPIVVDGIMFSSGPTGTVYAIEATTGEEIWSFTPSIDENVLRKVCCGIVNRGIAVWQNKIFVASIDGYLYALDASTGSIIWKMDTIEDRKRGYTITGSPYIADNKVIIGNSGAEFDARGYFSAYDTDTGTMHWRFYTVPGQPDKPYEHPELEVASKTWSEQSLWETGLGGTVWDGMAYDPNLELLYVGTGNGTPYARQLRSPGGGDNLFLSTILAIEPDSGKLVWHYQTTPADNWDYTSTQKMILADLKINGENRQVILQAPKNGFFYVLDRLTGELLSAEPYTKVNWASHVDKISGRPVETLQAEYFKKSKLIIPGPAGGHNWQPMAFNPKTGLVYIPVIEAAATYSMPKEPFVYQKGGNNSFSKYSFALDSASSKTVSPEIKGLLKAWDPINQKMVWESNTSGPWSGEMFATWNGGGVMTTAGDLVIQGRGTGFLVFLDANTGRELHSIDVGTSMMAAPMTYMVNGIQYIAIMAGLGGAAGQSYPDDSAAYKYGNKGRIVAFRLGGRTVPHPLEIEHANKGISKRPVERQGTLYEIKQGEKLFLRNCIKCHTDSINSQGIPTLRNMTAKTHVEFKDIVLKGIRSEFGMGNFSDLLSEQDVFSIHSYLIDLDWKEYEVQNNRNDYH